VEVPAAAEVTTAEPTHVAAAEATHVPAAEPTHMTAAKAAGVAEVSAGEMSPAAVEAEAVVEMVPSEEDRTPEAKAVIVIRIWVSVTIVVTRAVVGVVAAVWITGDGAADHSGRDPRSRIVAMIGIAVSVSPNIVVMTYVTTCDIPVNAVNAMCDTRMGRALVMVSDRRSVPVGVSDRRRICGGKRRQ
jgi:hypothetical protein